jgi:hypothetical protein
MIVALGCAGLVIIAAATTSFWLRDSSGSRPPTTWVVEDGQTRTFGQYETVPADNFRCSDGGGVEGVPSPGHGVGSSMGISVMTELDGTVTVTCDPGPPSNM